MLPINNLLFLFEKKRAHPGGTKFASGRLGAGQGPIEGWYPACPVPAKEVKGRMPLPQREPEKTYKWPGTPGALKRQFSKEN